MTKVIEKKLGREKALGQTHKEHPRAVIQIDPRQKPKSYLGTLIHEKLHIMHPDWKEPKILKDEHDLTDLLWENNYRQVKQGKSH